ncbi:hypothetical protein [Paraglaciecola polaris]|uniref:hypothetical protein n=1 Tax=Paraglaciecola polaris TaxID=222814 RepID=UPI001D043FF4|nr:hypothetical protein [Paraglaciecola polaris]
MHTRLFTVISELYNNALAHGVLPLDSELKHSPDGLEEYFVLRTQRLVQLKNINIKLSLTYEPTERLLKIVVRDSGGV